MCEHRAELVYRNSSEEDVGQIVDLLMENFVEDEPISRSMCIQGHRSKEDFRKLFMSNLNSITSPYTVVATDGPKVVGVRVVAKLTPTEYKQIWSPFKNDPIHKFMDKLNRKRIKSIDYFHSFLLLKFTAVAREYRNGGITSCMADWVIAKAKEDGISGILSEATDVYSQAALLKRGFECISEIEYSEYYDENGEVVFKHTDPHVSTKMLLLIL